MKKLFDLSKQLDAATLTQVRTLSQQLLSLLKTASVSLSPEEKQARTVAEGREGYVRLIGRIAKRYPDEFPRSYDLAEYQKYLEAFDQWRDILISMQALLETTEDTSFAIGVDLMTYTDAAYPLLDAARKRNGDIDETMKDVDDYNKRFGKKTETEIDNSKPEA